MGKPPLSKNTQNVKKYGFLSTLHINLNLNNSITCEKENQETVLVLYSALVGHSNDTSLISLRWIFRLAKIVCKKLIWVYSSSPRTKFS